MSYRRLPGRFAAIRLCRGLLGLALGLELACSNGGPPRTDGGGTGPIDAAPAGVTCERVRLCVAESACADDVCIETCKQMGTSTARTQFQALWDCTKTTGACAPPYDMSCLCMAQCVQDPPCTAALDACVPEADSDPICNVQCH